MKVQCSCGAKVEFDITPEMSSRPVQFVCPACGVDASEFVDGLVRQQLGQNQTPAGIPLRIQIRSTSPAAAAKPRLSVSTTPGAPPARPVVANSVPASQAGNLLQESGGVSCLKHPGEIAAEKCFICSKPICPKCMQLFGYVCSPLCKAKADSHGIDVPVFEGQQSVREARQWRKIVRVGWAVGTLGLLVLGFWFWYAWFGRMPKTIFSVRLPERAFSGHSTICGKQRDQIVFLHGGILARYDMKANREVWSANLIDKKKIQDEIEKEQRAMQKLIDKANNEGWDNVPKMPDSEKLAALMEREQAAELELHVIDQNVWVSSPGKLARYDWGTGKPDKEIVVRSAEFGRLISRGNELIVVDREGTKPIVTSINLASGDSRTEALGAPEALELAATNTRPSLANSAGKTGLPSIPGQDRDKPMDPAKVAEQFANLPYAAKLALPATLANARTQERTLREMEDESRRKTFETDTGPGSYFSLVPAKTGFVQFAVRLIEQKMVPRSAVKAAPGRSALEGNVTAGKSMDVANEFLNEMQRERGGGMVQDDMSRYEVTIRNPGSDEEWKGEVVGPPRLYPLETVKVVAAAQSISLFDKSNRKLWQAALSYNVRDLQALDEESALYGQGPCVEHKGTLYVIDEGMLTAFNLSNGRPKWRYVSVGIAGLFFDNKDMLYLNTTTASPDTIKYSRQIDISQKVASVIAKLDPSNGSVLWSAEPGGMISYVSDNFIYVVQSYQPEEEEDNPYRIETGFEKGPFLHIRRINPANGHDIWEHVQQRAPLDVAFEKNLIRLVFRKEVQVLKTLEF